MFKWITVIVVLVFGAVSFGDDVQIRSDAALAKFYETFQNSPKLGNEPQVSIGWPYCALALNKNCDTANKILAEYLSKQQDFFSKQGNPGHTLYWELILMAKMVNDPVLKQRLSPEAVKYIKGVLWDFTYNFDSPDRTSTAPDKLLRIFGSDNHDMIHRGIYFLTAQSLRNDPNYASRKYKCGSTAPERYKQWVDYMLAYFKARAGTGIHVEFGSIGYTGLYLQPIFLMADCSEDQRVRLQAKKYLTLFFADAAQEMMKGIRGGAKVRIYKGNWTVNHTGDSFWFYSHVFFGEPTELDMTVNHSCFVALVTSFRVPEFITELARNTEKKGAYEYITRRLGQGNVELLKEEYAAGCKTPLYYPTNPSLLYRYSYVTPDYILGWFTIDESKHYIYINSQNQWMGVVTGAGPDSRLVVQLTPSFDERTGFRELQAVGNKNAAIFRKQLCASDEAMLRVFYSQDFNNVEQENNWIFGQNGDKKMYFALRGTSPYGKDSYEITKDKLGCWIEFQNRDAVIIMETACAKDYLSFADFKKDVLDNVINWEEYKEAVEYKSSRAGDLKMYIDTRLPEVNGNTLNLMPEKVLSSPYISMIYGSSKVEMTGLNGEKLMLDFEYEK